MRPDVTIKHYRYHIQPSYDTPSFRLQLDNIVKNKGKVVASLKEDTTASVWRFDFNTRPLVAKRYNTRSIWHAIRRAFRKSRADNCREMADRFTQAGIYTAPNVAVIQEWIGPFKLRSWFISEYISGKVLTGFFENRRLTTPPGAELQTLQTNVSALFQALRETHLSHGDLKATNILLSEDRLYLIDLDAAHAHKNNNSFRRAHTKDQARFMKNWLQREDLHQIFEPLITNIPH